MPLFLKRQCGRTLGRWPAPFGRDGAARPVAAYAGAHDIVEHVAWGQNSHSARGAVTNFHQIACKCNGRWVGLLRKRQANGAAPPPPPPGPS